MSRIILIMIGLLLLSGIDSYAATANSTYEKNDSDARYESGSIVFNVWYKNPLDNSAPQKVCSQKLTITSDGNSDADLKNSNNVPTKWKATLTNLSGANYFSLTNDKVQTTQNADGRYQWVTFDCKFTVPSWNTRLKPQDEIDAYAVNPLPQSDKRCARLFLTASSNMDKKLDWSAREGSQTINTGFSANLCYFGVKPQNDEADGKWQWTSGVEYNIYLTRPTSIATFNGNGGTPNQQTKKGLVGEWIGAPSVSRAGFNFDKWTPAVGKYQPNNTTYTANWTAIPMPKMKEWVINAHVKKDGKKSCTVMQGLCGVGDKVYFIKKNKGDSKATLYTATISGGNIKSKSVKILKEDIKNLKHANGMTAVQSGDTTHLFIAPNKKGYIMHLSVTKDKKTKKPKVDNKGKAKKIKFPNGVKEMKGFKVTGIASFNKDGQTYYILKEGKGQRVVTIGNDLKMAYVSKFVLPKSERNNNKMYLSDQGSTCECDSFGNYYVPLSYKNEKEVIKFAKNAKIALKSKLSDSEKKSLEKLYNKTLRKTSYIEVYRLDISDVKNVKAFYVKTYKLTAGGKGKAVKWKKKKKKGQCVKFEIEDIYKKNGTKSIYFNSEGGTDCHDFLGRMIMKKQ